MNIKKDDTFIRVDMYVNDNTRVSFVWRDVGMDHVSHSYVHVYD